MARPNLPQFEPEYDFYKMRQLVDEMNRWIDTVEAATEAAGGGNGGGGTDVHNDLTGRDAADAHPISAITGLSATLAANAAAIGTNTANIAFNAAGISANAAAIAALRLLDLNDTDLTGQATGDLLFNVDGTNWEDTAGALTWDPITMRMLIGDGSVSASLEIDNTGTGSMILDHRSIANPRLDTSSITGSAFEFLGPAAPQWNYLAVSGTTAVLRVVGGPSILNEYIELFGNDSGVQTIRTSALSSFLDMEVNAGGSDVRLVLGTGLRMVEKLAGFANSPGEGQIWVRTNVANTLMFRDDANVDWVIGGALAVNNLQDAYDAATAVPQITLNGTPDPFTIDALVTGDVFAVRDTTNQDLIRLATTGGSIAGGSNAGNILDLQGALSGGADVGIVRSQSPITIAYDTVSNTTPAEPFALRWNPAFTATVAYVGGFLTVAPVVTISTGTFIPATFSDTSSMNTALAPGFSAFTFINELAVIRNQGNFNLMSGLVMNIGLTHERNSSGTSTTAGTTAVSMSAQTRATVSGAVMTKTSQVGLRMACSFSTVAGSTANLGALAAVHLLNPIVALFQPQAGVETATSIVGLEVNNLPFGGNIVKAAVRSAHLSTGTNSYFLLNNGNAPSDFLTSNIHFNTLFGPSFGGTVSAADLNIGTLAGGVLFLNWTTGDTGQLRMSSEVGGSTADRFLWFSTVRPEYTFDCDRFSLGPQTGTNGNTVGNFITPARTIALGGGWADFLLTQAASLTVAGFAMSDMSAWVVNAISLAASTGSITELATLRVGGMTTSNPGITVTERASLWVRGRHMQEGSVQYEPIVPAALTAGNNNDWAGLLTASPSNNTRYWARISGNVTTSVLTGIDATAVQDGDTFELTNVGANPIEITDDDAASTAANRILTATNETYNLLEDETITIRYDSTTARWRVVDKPPPPLRTLHLSGDQFRKGATAPTDVTIGTTPTVPALLFDLTTELASLYHSFPEDLDRDNDVVLRLQFSLSSVQLNLDTCDFSCDYTAPTEVTAEGIAKASTNVTGQFTAVTGRLAVGDIYEMDITFPFADATNPIANAVGIAFEIHLTNVTGVADIHLIDGDFIYTALRR